MLAPRPGLTAALGGLLGTPLGGVLLDRITRLPKEEAAADKNEVGALFLKKQYRTIPDLLDPC